MSAHSLSWPAPPYENAFVETASGMLSDLGLTIRGHHPVFWRTPLERSDLYVLHWPDAIFWGRASLKRLWIWIGRILTNLTLLKARGTRILWFVHNLEPHELSPERRQAWNAYAHGLSRLVDGWITLSPSTSGPAIARFPALARKRHTFLWHPPYADAWGGARAQARAELGLPDDAIVFGHAGQLRPYKNLAAFAAHFDKSAPHGAVLFLAGMAKGGAEQELEPLTSQVRGLEYREGRLSASEFDRALKAMDVFVAPYARFLHSGALVHALSRGCVVVVPRVPFTEDLAHELGAEWVVFLEGEPDDTVLSKAARAAQRQAGQSPDLTALDPAQNLGRLRGLLSDMGVRLPNGSTASERVAG